jgi:hypothetical protein
MAIRLVVVYVRESPASKTLNTEAEEATALEAVTRRQPVKTRRINACCSELQSVWISDVAVVTCIYVL